MFASLGVFSGVGGGRVGKKAPPPHLLKDEKHPGKAVPPPFNAGTGYNINPFLQRMQGQINSTDLAKYGPAASPFASTQSGLFSRYATNSLNKANLGVREYGAGVQRGQRLNTEALNYSGTTNANNRLFSGEMATLRTNAAKDAQARAEMQQRRAQRQAQLGQAGSAIGGVAGSLFGGPIGGMAGTALGGVIGGLFCFTPETAILMKNGLIKPIYRVELGDETAGGTVQSVRASMGADLYFYNDDVFVTSHHAVKEDGKWLRVKDSKYARRVADHALVYSLVTTEHRIFVPRSYDGDHSQILYDINDLTEFADEHETPLYETLNLDESLDYLNKKESLPNGK